MRNMIKVFILCSLIMVISTGCSSADTYTEEVELQGRIDTMTELGVPLEDLRDDMADFIIGTYMPDEGKTKEEYIQSIVKYLTESEYRILLSEIGEYNPNVMQTVSNITIRYGIMENSSDNCDKVLCSFDLLRETKGERFEDKVIIIFSIHNGEIDHHTVLFG